MSTRNNVLLKFYSHNGDIVRLNIPRADSALTGSRAQATMEDMITGGVILTANGIPTAIHGAELVTIARSPLVNA